MHRIASALHHAALRAFPSHFRARLGDDLHDTFTRRADQARARGHVRHLVAIGSGILDTLASGLAERGADRRVRARHARIASPSVRSLPMTWESIVSDTRQAFRHVRRAPMLAAMVVITLAIGIGANSAIFAAVYAALLKPLPYAQSGDLVAIWSHQTKLADENYPVSNANFDAFKRESTSFTQVEAMYSFLTNAQVEVGDSAETLKSASVTPGMFRMLGRQPLLGRGLQDGDELAVVLSYDYWQRRFGGDRTVIGQPLRRSGGAPPLTIVGVMDEDFIFPYRSMLGPSGFSRAQRADIWLLLTNVGFRMVDAAGQPNRTVHMLSVLARLKPGVSLPEARADLASIAERRAGDFPDTNDGFQITMRPLLDQTVGSIRPALMLLSTGVGLLLLLTCVNIANVLLARASGQQRDGAVRAALGASRARLLQQSMIESLVLSLFGGAAALVVVGVGSSALLALAPSDLPRIAETRLSPVVILVTFGTAVLTGLLTGLMPAIAAARVRPEDGLRESKRTTATRRQRFVRSSLVVAEVTLATVLTIGAGLLLRSFTAVLGVDPGFAADHLLTFQVGVPSRHVASAAQIGFYDELRDKLMAIPGVTHVGGSTRIPLGSTLVSSLLTVEHRDVPPADLPEVQMRRSVLDFFGTMRIPVLQGRVFNETDRLAPVAAAPATPATAPAPAEANAPPPEGVAVVNAALAARVFPNEQVIGRRVRLGSNPTGRWLRIIGVVGNVQHSNLEEKLLPEIYISHFQGPPTGPFMAVRTAGDPAAVITSVRAAIASLKADPPSNVRTMEELRQESVGERRFVLWLTGVFGLVAVLLAGVGVYGVISLIVSERTAEVGVRLALGATPGQMWSMLVTQAATLGAIGVALGAAAAFVLTPLAAAMLFGVSPADPWTFGGVSVLLVLIAIVAAAVPARRAMQVDPASALR